jgi:RHS repeat-associated protein
MVSPISSSSPKYYVADNLGSTSLVTDSTGNVLNESLYFPYGGERAISQNDTGNHYKYTGKERDAETGLDDFGARYYASNIGRFLTPDWAAKPVTVPYASFGDPQTLNLYAYVENAPLNRVDADGHWASTPLNASAINGGFSIGGLPCDGISNGEGFGCTALPDGSTIWDPFITDADRQNYEAYLAMVNASAADGQSQSGTQQAQQQNGSSGGGFWSRLGQHFGNLFHGHSWNYGMRELVTVRILPAEPIPGVTAATDAAGIVGLTSETAGKVLGPAGAAVSIANDRSPKNITTNVLSLIPGFEGMAIPAALTDFMDYSINHSRPGPQKVGDPTAPDELQPTLPTQDGGCLAAGMDGPCS